MQTEYGKSFYKSLHGFYIFIKKISWEMRRLSTLWSKFPDIQNSGSTFSERKERENLHHMDQFPANPPFSQATINHPYPHSPSSPWPWTNPGQTEQLPKEVITPGCKLLHFQDELISKRRKVTVSTGEKQGGSRGFLHLRAVAMTRIPFLT